MDEEKFDKNSKNMKALLEAGKILAALCDAGEPDPILMTDAEFNNFCNLVLVCRAQITNAKETIQDMEKSLEVTEAIVRVAKIIRGGTNDGSEEN